MSGLVIKLRPGERFMVNGAVLVNGDRRSSLSVATSGVNVLRLRDAIHPSEANTPAKRAMYKAQLVLANGVDQEIASRELFLAIEELSQVFRDSDSRNALDDATKALRSENFYMVMKSIKKLLPQEERILRFKGMI